ncbi:MAG: S9 family peptidase [Ktedonobacterales bacterium]|jgi:dipeptidyl aminopeptidase/acylaminoacyl peptidase|nr:MAG: S9 family peptidase [Ktedonobacterales bacterium]
MSDTPTGISEIPQRTPVSLDTLFSLRTPVDPRISPDGARVACTLMEWIPGRATQRGRIWLVDTNEHGGEPRPLTTGSDGDYEPRWSPDGRSLLFVSKRDEGDKAPYNDKPQLYTMPARGGDAHRVCSMPNGAADPEWSPDGTRVAFLSLDGDEVKAEPMVDEPLRHQRLWIARPGYDTAEPVTPADVTIWSYAWSPDGTQFAVFYSTGPGETDWYRGQIGIVPAAGGAIQQVSILSRQAGALAWSRDGHTIYYVSGEWSDRPLVGGDIFAIPAQGGNPRNLTPGIQGNPSWLYALEDGRLVFSAWDGLTNTIGALNADDGSRCQLSADFIIGDQARPQLSATPDGRRFAAVHTEAGRPWDVWLGMREGAGADEHITWRQLTRFNRIAEETLQIAPNQRISYTGADGWQIEALYTAPLTPTRGTPPPLILYVHGGPTSAFRDMWMDTLTQLFAAAGYAVLRANPRGSMGRGVAFADAVLGDMGGKDYQDVLAGVDHLVAQGLVDGERIGIYGWSYGGFMTAWAVTHTTRFKAAVMGAGICDYHSFHAQSNIPDWDMRIIGADPNENPQAYREKSAITYVARVNTPTLIVHGEADPCVPVNQAYAFFRALRERAIPTELAVYPRERHGFREREHIRDLYARILGWFVRWI